MIFQNSIFNFQSVYDQKINFYYCLALSVKFLIGGRLEGFNFHFFQVLISFRMFFFCYTGRYFCGKGAFGSSLFLLSVFMIDFSVIFNLIDFLTTLIIDQIPSIILKKSGPLGGGILNSGNEND